MALASQISDSTDIVLISQKVKDIKVPPNGRLEPMMGMLRAWCQDHGFIPGDKIPATVSPVAIRDGALLADITGKFLSSDLDVRIRQPFPLLLGDYRGAMDIIDIFSTVEGVQIDDGGNIQNMALNLAWAVQHAMQHPLLRHQRLRVTVASSSDPFQSLEGDLAAAIHKVFDVYQLAISDRCAIQVPYDADGQTGTLAIASEPSRTNGAIAKLLGEEPRFAAAFRRAKCFVSADPIYDQLPGSATPPYRTVVNASTAFRSLTAAESYNRAVLLPMNNGEASDVCKLLLQRGFEEELENIERPPFPSPLTTSGEEIDLTGLHDLDRSIDLLTRYVPLCRPGFTCPISFGEQGGLIVGAGHETVACFTSTPSPAGERAIIESFGDPSKVLWDRKYEVGAGDAVATVITLFNVLRPRLLVAGHMKDREKENRQLGELAATVFVSLLGRLAGTFLLRTRDTYWSNIRAEAFPELLDNVAAAALDVARGMVKRLQAPVIGEANKWGIKVVVWRPGSVAYPDRDSGVEAF